MGELDGRVVLVSGDRLAHVTSALAGEGAQLVSSPPSGGRLDVVVCRAGAGGFDDRVFALLELIQRVVPGLRGAGGGSVVIVADPAVGIDMLAAQALTVALQTLAAEVGPDGIRVNQIAAGPHVGADLANVVMFFASDRSRAITGQTLTVGSV